MEAANPVVLARMLEFLQGQLDASTARIQQLEAINDAQARVIRQTRIDHNETIEEVTRLTHGSAIVLRNLDDIYNHSKDLFLQGKIDSEEWDVIYRAMLRADIGFAILNGANYNDLTADEDIDDRTTEEESEVEAIEVEVRTHYEVEVIDLTGEETDEEMEVEI